MKDILFSDYEFVKVWFSFMYMFVYLYFEINCDLFLKVFVFG